MHFCCSDTHAVVNWPGQKSVTAPLLSERSTGRFLLEVDVSILCSCLPRTVPDSQKDAELNVLGDNDPVDVVEIGTAARAEGEVTVESCRRVVQDAFSNSLSVRYISGIPYHPYHEL